MTVVQTTDHRTRDATPPALPVPPAADSDRHDSGEAQAHHVPTHFTPQIGRTTSIIAGAIGLILAIGFLLVHYHRAHLAGTLKSQTQAAAAVDT